MSVTIGFGKPSWFPRLTERQRLTFLQNLDALVKRQIIIINAFQHFTESISEINAI